MIEINDSNFEDEVYKSKIPVFVDFWAEWCGPCKSLGPVFEEASRLYKNKIKFAKLNVDSNHELSAKFGVMSIPTLMLFNDGNEVDRSIGAISLETMKKFLNKHL